MTQPIRQRTWRVLAKECEIILTRCLALTMKTRKNRGTRSERRVRDERRHYPRMSSIVCAFYPQPYLYLCLSLLFDLYRRPGSSSSHCLPHTPPICTYISIPYRCGPDITSQSISNLSPCPQSISHKSPFPSTNYLLWSFWVILGV